MNIASLCDHLAELCASSDGADVIIEAVAEEDDGVSQDFSCHSIIISRSKVLQLAFSGPFEEGASKRIKIPVVKVKHLAAMREFLYRDNFFFEEADWTMQDLVHLMALCDKYEIGRAVGFAADKIAKRLRTAPVTEGQQSVDRLSVSIGAESFKSIVSELLESMLEQVHFGENLVQFLIWLLRLQEQIGMSFNMEARACFEKISNDDDKLNRELVLDGASLADPDVAKVTMLVTTKFVDKAKACTSPRSKLKFSSGFFARGLNDIFTENREAERRCPQNHRLTAYYKCTANPWRCDSCKEWVPKGAVLFGCRRCNYDECHVCYSRKEEEDMQDIEEDR